MAREQLTDIDMNGNTVTGLPTPSASSDATSKDYVDGYISLLSAAIGSLTTTANEQEILYWMGGE